MGTSKLYVMHCGHLNFILVSFFRILQVFQPVRKCFSAVACDTELSIRGFHMYSFLPQVLVGNLGFKDSRLFYHG